jgi:hypothetical protein
MFLKNKTISAYNSNQIAYPVELNKDSYSINSYFHQDINTLEVTVKHELVKNHMYNPKEEGKTYKEGAKFRELLYTGTYKECQDYFINTILPIEREWIRDEKLNYVYPN